ncbi:hypothetical protein FOZ62_025599, partial [Perkinsus olseni]
ELKHLQTIEFRAPDLGGPIGLNSIIVARDGSELLAVTDINGGTHVVRRQIFRYLWARSDYGDRYDISEAEAYPNIFDPDEEDEIVGSTLTLAVGGGYRRGGRGDLTVAFSDDVLQALRFRHGVRSVRSSTALDLSDLTSLCGLGTNSPSRLPLGAIARLDRLRGFRGNLLALCRDPSSDSSIPRVNLQAAVHSGGVYDGHNFRVFHVESIDHHEPTAVAQLRNGDIMIAFVRNDGSISLRIGYVKADKLRDAIVSGGRVDPLIIADLKRRQGFNVGYQTGLAVREDRRSGRIFVYSMSNDFFLANFREDEQPALLTTFEWIPK